MPHDIVSFDRLTAEAAMRHSDRGWPSSKDEAWRFTNINAIRKADFSPAKQASTEDSFSGEHLIYFINGIYQPIENMSFSKGIHCQKLSVDTDLSSALAAAVPDGHNVADFALAHASDGLAITIDQVVDAPLQMIFDCGGDGISSHAVLVFKLMPEAELTILEEHKGNGAGLSVSPLMLSVLKKGQNFIMRGD